MSIFSYIDYWVKESRLFELAPALGTPAVRRLLVSSNVQELIAGPWINQEWENRCGRLRADLDFFSEGRLVTVARHPYKGKSTYMLRLDPEREEVWEMRSRDPEPGIRVFGCFADTNVFVALTWAKRADLLGPKSREWRDARIQCKTEWRNLFQPYKPHLGPNLHDYLSNAVFV